MVDEARLRISLAAGELELAGSAEFFAQYDEVVREVLARLTDPARLTVAGPAVGQAAAQHLNGHPADGGIAAALPEFGGALHRLSNNASGTDQILVAGYYASRRRPDRTFGTSDANTLLVEQGIKLANPSQSLKNAMDSKRVFKAGKNFKLSRDGIQRVGQLLGLSTLES